MEQRTVKVTINGETKEYPCKITYGEIVKDYENTAEAPIILVMVNGRLRELHKHLKADCTIQFITTRDAIGNQTYKRSACLILLKAIYDVAGQDNTDKVVIHYSVGHGYFFTMKGGTALTQEFIDRVKERMHEIVDANLPIMKRSVNTDEAIALFHKHHMYDKEKLFNYRRVSRVNLYSIESFEDYFYGFMANHTGYIKYFDLFLYEGGFVLQLPDMAEPDKIPEFKPREKIFHVQKESQEWSDKLEISTVGDLNDKITRGNVNELVLVQEALQEEKIAQIAEQIKKRPDVRFVLIAGPSSSSKTTFSHRLSVQLRANGLCPYPIAVDNYFKEREENPKDENGNYDFEGLGAVDIKLFNQQLQDLRDGKEVVMPEFNFVTGHKEFRGPAKKLKENEVLVIEGIHCLNPELTKNLPDKNKFKIYISALTQLNIDEHNRIPTTDGRLIRRIIRDARTRGTSAKETIRMWPSVRKGEERNIFPYQEEADVMFNSALIYELAVLKPYVEALLFGIERDCSEYLEAKRLLKFLDYFVGIGSENVPANSLLREFIGGGCFRV